ncbi:MAG: alpha/beta fold hydrolase [Myxococcales bacterium]|nr:alpha/beta fold hydrolase [Myxococcales bacterium]
MAAHTTFTLTAADGLTLAGYVWKASGTVRGIVQLAHGMSEHALRYGPVAETLAGRGYTVYAHDHRGHGQSVRAGEELGHMADEDGWSLAVDDLHRVNRMIAAEEPGLPIVVLGHSMGSFLAQQLAFTHPEDATALALSASNGKPPAIATVGRGIARLERVRMGKRGQSRILNTLSFEDFNKRFRPNRTEFDWISRDESAVDAYVLDRKCGFMVSVQTWIDMLDALPKLTEPANLARVPKALPIYLFAGDRDPVGDMGKGVKRLADSYRGAWLTDVICKLYPEGRHEMMFETNRAAVLDELSAWLDRVTSVR